MDSDTMLGIHMFGDVQAYEQDISVDLEPDNEVETLVVLVEAYYGNWAVNILDQYTAQALSSLVGEYGAHNALELIIARQDPTNNF